MFSGVEGFRDLSIEYSERVTEVVGSVMWNSDKHGYQQEVKVERKEAWDAPALASGTTDESF